MSEVIDFRKPLPKLKPITEMPRKLTMESTVPQLATALAAQLDQRNRARIANEQGLAALDAAEERRLETQRGDAFIREAIKHIINKGEGLDAAVTCMIRRLQELKNCGE